MITKDTILKIIIASCFDQESNVTYPKDTIISRPKGIMFSTLNYGHIRSSMIITAMHVAEETTCDLRSQAIRMIDYILTARNHRGSNLTMGTTTVNSKILQDIKLKLRQNKTIPTTEFEQRTQIYKEELNRACNLVRQDMSLITELLLPWGVTGTIEHLHSQGNT